MIRFRCSECERKIGVDDDSKAGRLVICPACKARTRIPLVSTVPERSRKRSVPEPASRPAEMKNTPPAPPQPPSPPPPTPSAPPADPFYQNLISPVSPGSRIDDFEIGPGGEETVPQSDFEIELEEEKTISQDDFEINPYSDPAEVADLPPPPPPLPEAFSSPPDVAGVKVSAASEEEEDLVDLVEVVAEADIEEPEEEDLFAGSSEVEVSEEDDFFTDRDSEVKVPEEDDFFTDRDSEVDVLEALQDEEEFEPFDDPEPAPVQSTPKKRKARDDGYRDDYDEENLFEDDDEEEEEVAHSSGFITANRIRGIVAIILGIAMLLYLLLATSFPVAEEYVENARMIGLGLAGAFIAAGLFYLVMG